VDIKEDRLPGIGAAGDEYGDRDIVTGQMVVYAATVTVVTVVCVDSSAGQDDIVGAQRVMVISWVVYTVLVTKISPALEVSFA